MITDPTTAAASDDDARSPADGPVPANGPGSARRRFLRTGLATAAGAAAGAVLAGTGTAEAGDGDNLKIGQSNTGTAATVLGGSRLQVNQAAAGVTAITGNASGSDGFGVLGLASPSGNAIGVKGQGKTGVAGDGNYPGGTGVDGFGPIGVKGQSPANQGTGVRGVATGSNSTGVSGVSPSVGVFGEGELHGVAAFSNGGDALNAHTDGNGKRGVVAEAAGVGGIGVQVVAPNGPALRLGTGPAMPPATGTWSAGDLVANSGLWFCIVGGVGAASRWVKLSRTYQPLAAPVRIYDSRPGDPPPGVAKGKMASGQERVIDATVGGSVPAGAASAVEVNVTVVDTDASGWLSLFANGVPWPGTSTINWFQPASVVANGTTVAVDAAARFKIRAAGSTHVVVDVTGWYT
jgi:hypothetical protein